MSASIMRLWCTGVFCLMVASACAPRACMQDDWQRKDAWRSCGKAVDSWAGGAVEMDCAAMRMCLDEAPLEQLQRTRLHAMLKTRGCMMP